MAYNSPSPGQPQVQYPSPMVFFAAPTGTHQPMVIKNFGPYYKRQTSIGLGATQIVLACISIVAGGLALAYAGLGIIGIGIWAGAWYLIAGSITIAAGKGPTNNMIKTTLVFSVFDILFGIAQVLVASLGIADAFYCRQYYNDCSWNQAIAANSMMIGVGSLEIIFGIWMTVVCARAIDNGSKAQMPYAIPVTFATTQPGTVPMQAPPAVQPQPDSHYEQLHFPSTHRDILSGSSPDIIDEHKVLDAAHL